MITIELFTLFFAINTLSSVRAFVGAEGLYSKAQKDAVYSLRKYGSTRDEKYYEEYLRFLEVNLGDREARLELLQKKPDLDIVRNGLLKGRNHPEDINGMIKLFQRFNKIYYIKKSISFWTQVDALVLELQGLADNFHTYIQSGNATEKVITQRFQEFDTSSTN
mgnify:CR=1 FL=1